MYSLLNDYYCQSKNTDGKSDDESSKGKFFCHIYYANSNFTNKSILETNVRESSSESSDGKCNSTKCIQFYKHSIYFFLLYLNKR